MESRTKVVSENVDLKQEEAENKNKSKNNNGKKEAAVTPVNPANGEVIGAAVAAVTTDDSSAHIKKKKNREKKSNTRIQVSNTKKPFIFYLNLAKSYLQQYNKVELSALGMAIPTVITIAEILKRDGLVHNKEVKISTVNSKEDHRGSFSRRPKSPQIQIILGKAENLNKITTAADAATEPKMESDKQA
ncbi:uncharacterized protein At2g34160-like [Mangifera indica]|uniref:uncharacterized protein At2g34160-like n=1 Tax=Mangifera indica TaxID=29780 RepID=UPI001CF9718D|nr:uncharacterized protein At2g34160-like [Mangifera indica]